MTESLPVDEVCLVDVLDDKNRDDRENLGLASIAAVLRRHGIGVTLRSQLVSERLPPATFGSCRVLAFSIYPNTVDAVLRTATNVKNARPDVLVGLGGRLATDAASELIADCPAIDFCVLGDGELPMLDIVRAVHAGESIDSVPHLLTRSRRTATVSQTDIDELPWPCRDFLSMSLAEGNPTARVNSSWGCAASCTFCSVNSFFFRDLEVRREQRDLPRTSVGLIDKRPHVRPKWRGRTPEDVYREICTLERDRQITSFVFNDPSFEDPGTVGKARIRDLCERLVAHGTPLAFRCSMRAESFKPQDAELLALMRRAGFTHTFIGIESGNDDDLDAYNKIAGLADNEVALRLFDAADIDITMGFIMIGPYSTPERLRANYEFLRRHRASKVDHYIRKVDVYFRTALHDRLDRDGLLKADFSYDTPGAYTIRNGDIAYLDEALETLRTDPTCSEFDSRMYHAAYTLSTLRALDSGAAAGPGARFSRVRDDAAGLLSDFFEPVFVSGKSDVVAGALAEFRRSLALLCRDLRSVGAQVALASPFRRQLLAAMGDAPQPATPLPGTA